MSDLLKNSIVDIINNHYDFFLRKSNVTGIGLGFKRVNESVTLEPSLAVFVEKKIPSKNLYNHEIIPKKFLGIKTDVVQSATAESLDNANTLPVTIPFNQKSIRPIQPGYSIGIGSGYYGTLGAIVFDNVNNAPYILSNNHVLADTNLKDIGTSIVQPGSRFLFANEEGFSNMINNAVASLYKKVFLRKNNILNEVDCAIAKIFSNTAYNTEIYKIGKVTGIADAKIGDEVKKTGATTEYTTGVIEYINSIQFVNFTDFGQIKFSDCIVCSKISEKGDSGSLVLNSNNKAIGLLFGGGESSSILSPINKVLKLLNVHFE